MEALAAHEEYKALRIGKSSDKKESVGERVADELAAESSDPLASTDLSGKTSASTGKATKGNIQPMTPITTTRKINELTEAIEKQIKLRTCHTNLIGTRQHTHTTGGSNTRCTGPHSFRMSFNYEAAVFMPLEVAVLTSRSIGIFLSFV